MGEYGTLNESVNLVLFKHKVNLVFLVGNDAPVATNKFKPQSIGYKTFFMISWLSFSFTKQLIWQMHVSDKIMCTFFTYFLFIYFFFFFCSQ